MCGAGKTMSTLRCSSKNPPWLSGASVGQLVDSFATQKSFVYGSSVCPLVADQVILYGSKWKTRIVESTSWSGCAGETTKLSWGEGGGGEGEGLSLIHI